MKRGSFNGSFIGCPTRYHGNSSLFFLASFSLLSLFFLSSFSCLYVSFSKDDDGDSEDGVDGGGDDSDAVQLAEITGKSVRACKTALRVCDGDMNEAMMYALTTVRTGTGGKGG